MPDADSKRTSRQLRQWAHSAYEWMSTLIVALLVIVVLFTFFFRVIRVEGDSMVPTLNGGDQLLLSTM